MMNKTLQSLLHFYFFLRRGTTLGVRVLLVFRKSKVVLVKHTYQDGWWLPGGGVEHGHTLTETARKEIKEETGLVLGDDLRLLSMHLNKLVSNRDHIATFLATIDSDEMLSSSSAEISQVQLFDMHNLPSDVDAGSKRRIQEHLTSSSPSLYW